MYLAVERLVIRPSISLTIREVESQRWIPQLDRDPRLTHEGVKPWATVKLSYHSSKHKPHLQSEDELETYGRGRYQGSSS
jgi:hypothetical protein